MQNKPNQTQPVVSLPAVSKVEPSNLLQLFAAGCHTEKILFVNRLNEESQLS